MFLNSKLAKTLISFSFVLVFAAVFLAKGAKPVFATPYNLTATAGCFGDAGFIKFEWNDSEISSYYYLDVREPGAAWPDATHPGQYIPGTTTSYTWGGLSGITNIGIGPFSYESGGFAPGVTYEWRIWNGLVDTYPTPASVTAPTCGPPPTPPPGDAINFTLALQSSAGCDFVFSIARKDGTPGAGHNSALAVLGAGYTSPIIPDGVTSVTYTAHQKGADTAVLRLAWVDISNTVPFTAPDNCNNWNNPDNPAPPFNIMDVFQPAKRFGSFGQLVSDVLLVLVSLAGALALFFIVLAGFKFATSSGDEKKLASAKGTLTYAIIGIAVIVLAFVIVRILQYFLQSNIPIT